MDFDDTENVHSSANTVDIKNIDEDLEEAMMNVFDF
jgi:hypothetical protein